MNKKDIDAMTFEQALETLEKTADSLRSGRLSLEESVEVYDNSILLYNRCRGILDKAKQKIEIYRPQDGKTEEFEG
ncbi:MAG: exodeoxyribonuclease VII small subunit [Firmicutes bacterium]|nr:exodeoxyribonuclease VII small subunit [Bacillota bacterium]